MNIRRKILPSLLIIVGIMLIVFALGTFDVYGNGDSTLLQCLGSFILFGVFGCAFVLGGLELDYYRDRRNR